MNRHYLQRAPAAYHMHMSPSPAMKFNRKYVGHMPNSLTEKGAHGEDGSS